MKTPLRELMRSAHLRRWRTHIDLVVVIALFGVTALVFGFVELADDVSEGEVTFEHALIFALREASTPDDPVGRGWIQQMWLNITALGSVTIVLLFSTIVVGYLAMLGEWRTAGVVVGGIVGAMLTSTLLKGVFDRPRPDIVPHMVDVASASFPSGHSLVSAVVYPTLGSLLTRLVEHWRLKIYFLAVAMLLTVLIGVSRIYLGVHYPTDVLAGWMLGLGWGIVCWLVLRTLQRRRVVEPPGASPPDAQKAGV
jgi:undecaprenyl-diphosphatase